MNAQPQHAFDPLSFRGGVIEVIITDRLAHAHASRFGVDSQREEGQNFPRALEIKFTEAGKSFLEGSHVGTRVEREIGIFGENQNVLSLREQVNAEAEGFLESFRCVINGNPARRAQERNVDFGDGFRQLVTDGRRDVKLRLHKVAAQVIGRETRVEHVGVDPEIHFQRKRRAHRDRSERAEVVGDHDGGSRFGQIVRVQQIPAPDPILEHAGDKTVESLVQGCFST